MVKFEKFYQHQFDIRTQVNRHLQNWWYFWIFGEKHFVDNFSHQNIWSDVV